MVPLPVGGGRGHKNLACLRNLLFFGCDLESNALGGIEIYEKTNKFFDFWSPGVEVGAIWSRGVNLVRSGREA